MSPFVDFLVDEQRLPSLWPLRDNDLYPSFIHFLYDPIRVERFVSEHGVERYTFNQGRNTDRVVAVTRQQLEPNQIA